jgi:hypothetical protein
MPLAEWGRLAGVHPLHLMGINLEDIQTRLGCSTVWAQHEWQMSDSVSREELARAIRSAEDDIEEILGYHLIPWWDADERASLPRHYRAAYSRFSSIDQRGYSHSFRAQWGQYIRSGVRTKSAVALAEAITWAAADSVGWKATGSVAVATSVTDSNELHLYYPGEAADDLYEIQPISVEISAGTATITFKRELCVLESLEGKVEPWTTAIDGELDANFLGTVDVYRVYNDPSDNATLIWESLPGCGECLGTGCDTCGYYHQYACITARDYLHSVLVWTPATYTDGEWVSAARARDRTPDMLTLNYKSGFQSPTARYERDMDPRLQRAVYLLSISRLHRTLCGCMSSSFNELQRDMAISEAGTSFRISDIDLNNPFGTRRGAVEAWRIVSKFPNTNLNRGAVAT